MKERGEKKEQQISPRWPAFDCDSWSSEQSEDTEEKEIISDVIGNTFPKARCGSLQTEKAFQVLFCINKMSTFRHSLYEEI